MIAPASPQSIFFESSDVVLVIGNAESALPAAQQLATRLKVVAVLNDAHPVPAVAAGISVVCGVVTELSGHLGEFTARGAVPQGSADLAPLSPNESGCFDMVVDFSDPPLLSAEVSPYGYYPVARNEKLLHRALAEAPRLVGRFSKSKYFRFDAGSCAHDSKGVTGCSRCLSSCPANAISVTNEQIHVDAFLCKGCGTCTLVCPTGALSYAHQGTTTPLRQAEEMVRRTRNHGADSLHVVLHGAAVDAGKLENWLQQLGDHVLPIACKVVTSTGMETWLGILALGNVRLTLLVDNRLPSLSYSALLEELARTLELLQAMGIDEEVIALSNVDEPAATQSTFTATKYTGRPADMNSKHAGTNKRELAWQALGDLSLQFNIQGSESALSQGAAFGAIRVNDNCTLCHACSKLCPTHAIQQSDDMQKLLFTEERCVQCGMCLHGCPENAVTLIPRLSLDSTKRALPHLLHEGEMATCIECGAPIMPQALLNAGFKHVKNHSLFQGDGARAFKLCNHCRVQAAALDQVLNRESTHVM